jgi:hypothetical protein
MRIVIAAALVCGALAATPPAWAAPDACGALGGVVESSGLCHVQAGAAGYALDMRFPLDYPDTQAMVDYLTQTRDGFVNVAQTPDSRNVPHQMDVTAESFRSARTRSVVLTLFQDVGGAHPTTWYKSFTYAIFPIVQRTLQDETGLAASISPGDGLDPTHYQNFAVTDDAVIFFFGRAELLPSYAGESSVTLPRNAIPPLQV